MKQSTCKKCEREFFRAGETQVYCSPCLQMSRWDALDKERSLRTKKFREVREQWWDIAILNEERRRYNEWKYGSPEESM